MVSRLWVLPFAPSPLVPLAFTLALALPTYAALRFRQEREVASEHAVEFVAG
jgi:hypothetical protein